MGLGTAPHSRFPFAHISADQVRHPADQKACAVLDGFPGFHWACEKVLEHSLEGYLHLETLAEDVQVTPGMFPTLYNELREACSTVGVTEPELFVEASGTPNAFTFNHAKPVVVITSALIDAFSREERMFVLGHELGHIKAEHTLYLTIAGWFSAAVSAASSMSMGVARILSATVRYPLLYWSRQAELTADRFGLLCSQDIEASVRSLMLLAAGGTHLKHEMNTLEFIRQCHRYELKDSSKVDQAFKVLQTYDRSHPFPVLRAKELLIWHESGYKSLVPLILSEA